MTAAQRAQVREKDHAQIEDRKEDTIMTETKAISDNLVDLFKNRTHSKLAQLLRETLEQYKNEFYRNVSGARKRTKTRCA